jgi:N-acetylglucosaminyldiphosphoundecaprenol N-acetyl-beta-D-mannosaminyltransferase
MIVSGDRPRFRIGHIAIDRVSFEGALARIEALVEGRCGGAVYTPNVDHVVLAERASAFRDAYAAADLSLVDGQLLVWASRLLGEALPAKISGSDLVPRLLERAARRGWRVHLLGGGPGVGQVAALRLRERYGDVVAAIDAPSVAEVPSAVDDAIVDTIRRAGAELVLVGLGAPKQELLIHRIRSRIAPAVALAIGATLDFIAGRQKRAPAWVSRAGLEWLYRLAHEPRLARRYLVRDPLFIVVLLREMRRTAVRQGE